MPLQGCDIIGEIRYGNDLSFEDVGEVEASLRGRIEDMLSVLGPMYVDFRSSGDDLSFLTTLKDFDAEELRGICQELVSVMDPGATGRLVAVASGFGMVQVLTFSPRGVDEASIDGDT